MWPVDARLHRPDYPVNRFVSKSWPVAYLEACTERVHHRPPLICRCRRRVRRAKNFSKVSTRRLRLRMARQSRVHPLQVPYATLIAEKKDGSPVC